MERTELLETLGETAKAGHVWKQHVNGKEGENFVILLPSSGAFTVLFVEQPHQEGQEDRQGQREVPRISDFIGYGKKFNPEYRSTEDVMRELREGDDD